LLETPVEVILLRRQLSCRSGRERLSRAIVMVALHPKSDIPLTYFLYNLLPHLSPIHAQFDPTVAVLRSRVYGMQNKATIGISKQLKSEEYRKQASKCDDIISTD
jgi:hypothetical protein